ncbi:MAG TPA: DUF664 domain-containing protein [Segeticoccus sp.]|jgi:uncharacterized damage-inducible protein DinB|nr:DUF664 domain-containing protein [Segeticoccus sp.]
MAAVNEALVDGFNRVQESVHAAVEGLSTEQLAHRVGPEANTIGWLVWHLTRVEDDHIADLAETDQVWTSQDWVTRFDLPFEERATGFGQDPDEVARVEVTVDLLRGYHDAVHEQAVRYLEALDESALSDVIDDSWDPPVTRVVRLVSVLNDTTQHVGQAAFVRGLVERS